MWLLISKNKGFTPLLKLFNVTREHRILYWLRYIGVFLNCCNSMIWIYTILMGLMISRNAVVKCKHVFLIDYWRRYLNIAQWCMHNPNMYTKHIRKGCKQNHQYLTLAFATWVIIWVTTSRTLCRQEWRTIFALSRVPFCCLFPKLRCSCNY